ncbi:MAG: transcription antitermination factor NusB [Melioribacteraceae bacterium]|nr:transcription antitermination factor NusB [Melioribacteraceae bacterium]
MHKKSHRRILREKVLQALYAYRMNGEGLSNITEGILIDTDNSNDKKFCKDLINFVVANEDDLEKRIEERVSNWEIDRIAVIDKILLKMCITEILFFPDIPPKVSINEVIDMAKEYSTSNSGKFINGILDAILSDLKKEGNLKKTGRGLIDETPSGKSS